MCLHGGLVGDSRVHVEEVAVALVEGRRAEAADGVREVEVDAVLERADALALVDHRLRVAGGDVAGHEVAERRVLPLEEVVAVGVGDLVGGAGVVAVLRRSEEHTSELQSLMRISYAVFCLTKKKTINTQS